MWILLIYCVFLFARQARTQQILNVCDADLILSVVFVANVLMFSFVFLIYEHVFVACNALSINIIVAVSQFSPRRFVHMDLIIEPHQNKKP